jgi:hypothetical protein
MTRGITQHTLESLLARTVEIGECREWQGYIGNDTPQVSHGGKMMTVRRLMFELQGKDVEGYYIEPQCGNSRCVNPAHAVARTNAAHLKRMSRNVDHRGLMRIIKLQQVAKNRRKLTDEQVSQIRNDARPSRAVAEELGVSKNLVCLIRAGKAHRAVSANPFAGLMNRNQK